ncbi:MAG: hypothetical protein AAGI91_00470 [Bacteroidota bacterium]
MPTSKTTSTRKAPSRRTKASATKRSSASRARSVQRSGRKALTSPSRLPSWSDLASKRGASARRAKAPKRGLAEGVPTLRFAGYVAAACVLLTLYVGHIYSTQELAAEVQQLQRENHRLVLKHNRLRGAFDRMTAPSVILQRAGALGLETGSAYGPTIQLETPSR